MSKRAILATASAQCRASLEQLLTTGGYAVLPAADTQEALALLRSSGPDLLLVDARLPGVTADAMVQLLRPASEAPKRKLVLVTSLDDHTPPPAEVGYSSGEGQAGAETPATDLVDMLQAKSLEAELLREMGRFTAHGGDLATACGRLLELALRLTGATGALLVVQEEQLLTYVASAAPLSASFWRRLMGRAASTTLGADWGRHELAELEEGLEFSLEALPADCKAQNPAIRAFTALPLMGRGKQRGVLALGYSKQPRLARATQEAINLAFPYAGVILENLLLHRKLWAISREDELTKLANRRDFEERLELEFKRYKRYGTGFSLLMLDLDHLKAINDGLGHMYGDEVLTRVGAALRAGLRSVDVSARYGGDEFVAILPETTSHLRRIGERLHRSIEREIFRVPGVQALKGTGISMGIACCPDHGTTRKSLIEAADAALYEAKLGYGERKVCLAKTLQGPPVPKTSQA